MADIGWVRPPLPDLVAQIRTDLLTSLSLDEVLRRSDLEVQARVQAAALHTLYGFVEHLAHQILPCSATGEWLERHGAWRGVMRKPAREATGSAEFRASPGSAFLPHTVIPEGTRLQKAGGIDYVVAESTVAEGASVVVPIRAANAGQHGNAEPGTFLSLVNPVAGVQPVAVSGELSGGVDREDQEAYRNRIMQYDRMTACGGNLDDYRKWVMETPGVRISKVWVYRHSLGTDAHGITFIVSGRAGFIPTDAEVGLVQKHIDQFRPAGADPHVFKPVEMPVNPRIAISPDKPETRHAIEQELQDFFFREAKPGGTVRLSRLSEAISAAAGEVWHTLHAPERSLALEAGQIATPGTILWG